MKKVGIIGFEQNSRYLIRKLSEIKKIDIYIISHIEIKTIYHLLKYDSIYGTFLGKIEIKKNYISINNNNIYILDYKQIEKIQLDFIIDLSNKKNSEILKNISKKVISSYYYTNSNIITYGFNEGDIKKNNRLYYMSEQSTCILPIIQIINNKSTINFINILCLSSYDQNSALHDSAGYSKEKSRASCISIFGEEKSVSQDIMLVIPKLKNKTSYKNLNVPIPSINYIEITFELCKEPKVDFINNLFIENNKINSTFFLCNDPIVSIDVKGTTYSSVINSLETRVINNTIQVCYWYDKTSSYINRILDVIKEYYKPKTI